MGCLLLFFCLALTPMMPTLYIAQDNNPLQKKIAELRTQLGPGDEKHSNDENDERIAGYNKAIELGVASTVLRRMEEGKL